MLEPKLDLAPRPPSTQLVKRDVGLWVRVRVRVRVGAGVGVGVRLEVGVVG